MGQPGTVKQCHPPIYRGKQTRRTETSKYPEEEKTIVIPLVVAIERGIAQTMTVLADMGL
jgi:hypothetical protein